MADVLETSDATASSVTPYAIKVGETFQGTLASRDSDWVRFEHSGNGPIAIAAVGVGALSTGISDTNITLRNASGAIIGTDADGGPGSYATYITNGLAAGTYYIEVTSSRARTTGDYMLNVTEGSKPSFDVEMGAAVLYRSDASWSNSAKTPTIVTWGARTSDEYSTDGAGRDAPFSQLTTAQVAAVERSLALFSDVSGLKFEQVNPGGTTNDATILVSNYWSSTDGASAFSSLPGTRDGDDYSGDVFLNSNRISTTSLPTGSFSQYVITHELGHSIGLDHPGDYNASPGQRIDYNEHAQFVEDSRQYTVMTYFGQGSTGANFRDYPDTLMLYDIYAVQQLYGANMETRKGDTVYGFNSNAGAVYDFAINTTPALSIWDAGGNDVLDVSGYSQNQTIDLREGGFSSIGGYSKNVSIAYGAVVERAVGGSGNDTILGNSAGNELIGGVGNDALYGDAGDDYLDGEAGNDLLSGGAGDDYLKSDSGNGEFGAGSDRFDGGAGIDTLYLDRSGETVGLELSISNPALLSQSQDGTSIINVEQFYVYSGAGNDSITGGAFDDYVMSAAGDDFLAGGAGEDMLFGEDGNDRLEGDGGDDYLDGGDGNDILNGGAGDDALVGGSGSDVFIFVLGGGADIVFDFEQGRDRFGIDQSTFGITHGASVDDYLVFSDVEGTDGRGFFTVTENALYWQANDDLQDPLVQIVSFSVPTQLQFSDFSWV